MYVKIELRQAEVAFMSCAQCILYGNMCDGDTEEDGIQEKFRNCGELGYWAICQEDT